MAYALSTTGREDTRYTIFENNQVLTADQLNDLHHYLNVQDRATRTRVMGVGIVGGLQLGLLESGNIVVSRGVAITTDGDLAWFDNDIEFSGYRLFEDLDAQYPPFANLVLYELQDTTGRGDTNSTPLRQFEATTQTQLRDYTGLLYLESYDWDPDQCTGADCDNRGKEVMRTWRFLLVHQNQLKPLLESLPPLNQSYFALPDVRLKRVVVNPAIDTYAELQASFNNALSAKDDLKNALAILWTQSGFLADDILGANPVPEWHKLLDEQFARYQRTIFVQYLYDYCRDLADAYQELKDLLFDDNVLLCPDVQLFPRHILLGKIQSAAPLPGISTRPFPRLATSLFRFNLDASLLRFHRFNPDDPTRHQFYESPVLNAKGERLQQLRFGFMRLHQLLRNFAIPDKAAVGTAANIRITPGVFVDRPLGQRAIPYYFGAANGSASLPAYWSYEANIRRREALHRSWFAAKYSSDPYVVEPFGFDMAESTFYRIEGHIGFKYPEVERRLNALISQHNLPINIMTVQVERVLDTIPVKPWWFGHLNNYELIQRRAVADQLTQAEFTHNSLTEELKRDSSRQQDLQAITPIVNQFNAAKGTFLTNYANLARPADSAKMSAELESLARSATELKASTRQFTFSNAAAPHDFVINTNAHIKLDLINDLINQQIEKKRTDLFLGNFLVKNPGLEHAGGVLRGGTFVLVYTSSDSVVVADFMLPYASVDQDIQQPPTLKPLPLKPRFELPKLWEKIPQYEKLIDRRWVDLDTRFLKVDTELTNRLKLVNDDIAQKVANTQLLVTARMADVDKRLSGVNDQILGRVDEQVTMKIDTVTKDFSRQVQTTLASEQNKFYNSFITTLKLDSKVGATPPGGGRVVVGAVDLSKEADRINDLTAELKNQPNLPPAVRKQKEEELVAAVTVVNEATRRGAASGAIDKESANVIKAIQFDVSEAANVISDVNARANVEAVNKNIRVILARRPNG